MGKSYRHVANIQGSYLQKKMEEKGGVLSELFNSVPLFDAVSNSGHVIMGQWMTHKINNNNNIIIIHKSNQLSINPITYK